MSIAEQIDVGIHEVGLALRRPEELAVRWRDRASKKDEAPHPAVFPILLGNAILGIAAYGVTMGLHGGAGEMLRDLALAPLTAGTAWLMALPALYIINVALGSRLDSSTTLLAALTTVSFGALAMLASVPISWFFTVAVDSTFVRIAVHLLVFTGVGICMADVFLRVMQALEPRRSRVYPFFWLVLVGVIGAELMAAADLFRF